MFFFCIFMLHKFHTVLKHKQWDIPFHHKTVLGCILFMALLFFSLLSSVELFRIWTSHTCITLYIYVILAQGKKCVHQHCVWGSYFLIRSTKPPRDEYPWIFSLPDPWRSPWQPFKGHVNSPFPKRSPAELLLALVCVFQCAWLLLVWSW